MELREAIEEVRGVMPTGYQWLDEDFVAENSPEEAGTLEAAYATILNAVADGTLIPADVVFQVRDGFRVYALKSNGAFDIVSAPLSEALEIRSAYDVRREALEDAARLCDEEMNRLYDGRHEGYGAGLYDEAEGLATDIRALSPTDNTTTVAEVRTWREQRDPNPEFSEWSLNCRLRAAQKGEPQ